MKRSIMVFLMVILLLASVNMIMAQVQVYPQTGGGILASDGHPSVFQAFGGFNMNIVQDTTNGYVVFNRTQVTYANGYDPGETEGGTIFFLIRKSFGIKSTFLSSFHATTGAGLFYRVITGEGDQKVGVYKMELGADIYKSFGINLGVDYIADQESMYMPYIMLDFAPPT